MFAHEFEQDVEQPLAELNWERIPKNSRRIIDDFLLELDSEADPLISDTGLVRSHLFNHLRWVLKPDGDGLSNRMLGADFSRESENLESDGFLESAQFFRSMAECFYAIAKPRTPRR